MSEERPETIKVLAGIICNYMDLTMEKEVWIYNQKFLIPDTKGIFVYVSFMRSFTIGGSKSYEARNGGLVEVQGLNVRETYGVDLFSWDSSARQRNHEIPMALNSTYAQQQQEKYNFQIGRQPTSYVDSSRVEGAKRLNRYSLMFNVTAYYEKDRVVEYFDRYQIPPETILIEA